MSQPQATGVQASYVDDIPISLNFNPTSGVRDNIADFGKNLFDFRIGSGAVNKADMFSQPLVLPLLFFALILILALLKR